MASRYSKCAYCTSTGASALQYTTVTAESRVVSNSAYGPAYVCCFPEVVRGCEGWEKEENSNEGDEGTEVNANKEGRWLVPFSQFGG